MKAAFMVWGRPQTFGPNNTLNLVIPLMFRPDFYSDATIKKLQAIPGVAALGVIQDTAPKEGEHHQLPGKVEGYSAIHDNLNAAMYPVRVLVVAIPGVLLEDLWLEITDVLNALATEQGLKHDPTEVVLMDAAQARQRQHATTGLQHIVPPVTDQRRRAQRFK